MISNKYYFILINLFLCLFVRRSNGCIATIVANPVCSRCPTFTLTQPLPPATDPTLRSVTSLDSNGCTELTITCTGIDATMSVSLQFFNGATVVVESTDIMATNTIVRTITCNSAGEYVIPLTTPAMALQPVTSVSCCYTLTCPPLP